MTTLTRQDLNFGQVVADVLCEFLEVAVHLILYVREVYPIGIFQKRKKYNVPVQMSCHPELNQYIQDTLHCVKPLLEKNDVEKVVVVILDKEHHPVERFVFEITQPPLLSISSDSLLSHVEQLLRAFILKISVCDAVLDHNPPGCTFTVLVHTREAATRNMEKIQVIKVSRGAAHAGFRWGAGWAGGAGRMRWRCGPQVPVGSFVAPRDGFGDRLALARVPLSVSNPPVGLAQTGNGPAAAGSE
uniref:Mitotic spindle assembly checkpoint protein MAD2B n=1 Tax=Ornithorhynchus anatinus TaxID=9258 RepID=A0A6I8MYP2_ORNAN